MSMSKRDFIALADAIRDSNQRFESGAITAQRFSEEHCCVLADFCKAANPNFKRDRWLDYIAGNCGKNGGAVKKAGAK
jgi:hypothetical protein